MPDMPEYPKIHTLYKRAGRGEDYQRALTAAQAEDVYG